MSVDASLRPAAGSEPARRHSRAAAAGRLGSTPATARGTRVVSAERAAHVRPHSLPRVDYLATGGTIASVRSEHDSAATPILTAETIASSVAGIDEVAELVTTQFMQRPSPSITFADLLRLRGEIAHRVADGSGVSSSHRGPTRSRRPTSRST